MIKSKVEIKHFSIVRLMSPGRVRTQVRTHSDFCWTRGLGLRPTGLGLGLWSNGLGLTPDALGLWPDGLGLGLWPCGLGLTAGLTETGQFGHTTNSATIIKKSQFGHKRKSVRPHEISIIIVIG